MLRIMFTLISALVFVACASTSGHRVTEKESDTPDSETLTPAQQRAVSAHLKKELPALMDKVGVSFYLYCRYDVATRSTCSTRSLLPSGVLAKVQRRDMGAVHTK